MWRAGPASAEHRRHALSPRGQSCQAKSAGGTPPARAIIASNALATFAAKSDLTEIVPDLQEWGRWKVRARLTVPAYVVEYGLKPAARRFGLDRKTLRAWQTRCRADGGECLSKACQWAG